MVQKQTEIYGHQKRYNQKMASQGLRRVTVWVPEAQSDQITKLAESLRKKAVAA
jgi:hypothetical protein